MPELSNVGQMMYDGKNQDDSFDTFKILGPQKVKDCSTIVIRTKVMVLSLIDEENFYQCMGCHYPYGISQSSTKYTAFLTKTRCYLGFSKWI